MKSIGYRLSCSLLLAFVTLPAHSEPNLFGVTGLINMPDGRIGEDGTLNIGFSHQSPYNTLWGSIAALPRVEFTGRYTENTRLSGFGDNDPRSLTYGHEKDKSIDAKVLLLKESTYLPALSIGADDFIGTGIYSDQYVAASKKIGPLDATLGYGRQRIDGAFGGLRYQPSFLPNWALVAEYNATDYARDIGAQRSGVAERKKGPAYGIEYHWGWLGAKLTWQHDAPGALVYLSIPLNQRNYVPKIDEPKPYSETPAKVSATVWTHDPSYQRNLIQALQAQDFQSIVINTAPGVLKVQLTNARISDMNRAVGRAARTILAWAPADTQQLQVTYVESDLPIATYTFTDLDQLKQFYMGHATADDITSHARITFASASIQATPPTRHSLPAVQNDTSKLALQYNEDGELFRLHNVDANQNSFDISPKVDLYFNDPSGALRYDAILHGTFDRHLANKLYLNTDVGLTVAQDFNQVTQPSNSLLPHVRSDIAEYEKTGRFKLYRGVLNRYYQPAERVYARTSIGIYEEMYGGAGGQILYLPRSGNWAADFSSDWVKQRDFNGGLGFRHYSTVTTIGSLHYRLPYLPSMTATLRVGEFLAKDKGARLELKRRFLSGIEAGAWYTKTNGHDTTFPGFPDKPYSDKGIFLAIPFDILLPKDTKAVGGFSISPWTRDVGQMVQSPGDLYDIIEKPVMVDLREPDRIEELRY